MAILLIQFALDDVVVHRIDDQVLQVARRVHVLKQRVRVTYKNALVKWQFSIK